MNPTAPSVARPISAQVKRFRAAWDRRGSANHSAADHVRAEDLCPWCIHRGAEAYEADGSLPSLGINKYGMRCLVCGGSGKSVKAIMADNVRRREGRLPVNHMTIHPQVFNLAVRNELFSGLSQGWLTADDVRRREGRKVNDVPPAGMMRPAIKEWARMRAVQAWQERTELHGPQPIPWPRAWYYAWRIAAMLAWACGVWILAEWI